MSPLKRQKIVNVLFNDEITLCKIKTKIQKLLKKKKNLKLKKKKQTKNGGQEKINFDFYR
jgi:hypothetical protein